MIPTLFALVFVPAALAGLCIAVTIGFRNFDPTETTNDEREP